MTKSRISAKLGHNLKVAQMVNCKIIKIFPLDAYTRKRSHLGGNHFWHQEPVLRFPLSPWYHLISLKTTQSKRTEEWVDRGCTYVRHGKCTRAVNGTVRKLSYNQFIICAGGERRTYDCSVTWSHHLPHSMQYSSGVTMRTRHRICHFPRWNADICYQWIIIHCSLFCWLT